ncbi:MAG: hypothetical protein ACI4GD_08795 [Lachnospiraceae bacterium]
MKKRLYWKGFYALLLLILTLLCGCSSISESPEVYLIPGPDFNEIVSNQFTTLSFVNQKPSGANKKNDIDLSLNADKSVLLYKDGFDYYVYPAKKNATIVANFDCSSMFSNCDNVTKINFENFNTTYTTNFSYMFSGCISLKEISALEQLEIDITDNINSIFYNCNSMKINDVLSLWFPECFKENNVTSPEANTGLKIIYIDIFDNTGRLNEYIYLTEAVTYNYLLQNCGIFEYNTNNVFTYCCAIDGMPIEPFEYTFHINGMSANIFLSNGDIITVKPFNNSSGLSIPLDSLERIDEGNSYDLEHINQGKTTLISRICK